MVPKTTFERFFSDPRNEDSNFFESSGIRQFYHMQTTYFDELGYSDHRYKYAL